MERKLRSDALSKKISPDQKFQLIEWLAEHSYSAVIEMAKADPPAGFGLAISKPALSRFYQAHFDEIDPLRQETAHNRSMEHNRPLIRNNQMRRDFHQTAALRLQEHLCQILAQPIESAAELKTLAHVCKLTTALGVDLGDPDKKELLLDQISVLKKIISLHHTESNLPPSANCSPKIIDQLKK